MVRYNFTKAEYDAMYFEQSGKCLICEVQEATVIDHDHKCCYGVSRVTCGKCIRGLLCRWCNTDLQWYENNMKNVDRYLER